MWTKTEKHLYQRFEFKNFSESIKFINQVADIAKKLNHHPKLTNSYNIVELWLSTHDEGGIVTEKDEAFAKEVSALFSLDDDEPAKHNTGLKHVKLHTDGGSRGNPGPSAIGYVISSPSDEVIKKEGRFLGNTTNNQAEYLALLEGLEACKNLGCKKVDVFMDSLLIVNQIKGVYKVKNKDLMPHYLSAIKHIERFELVKFTHVRRELNSIADGMVNECLDAQ